MIRITLLGTGTPVIDPLRQHSALLVEIDGHKLLFDAGRGVTTQLLQAGTLPQSVDALFLTHHHYDHIGNLGEFLLTAWHNGRTTPFPIYGPPGTAAIVTALLTQVYARDIAFALALDPSVTDIRKLVQVQEVSAGLVCDTGHYRVLTAPVDHGHSLGLTREAWPCLGYRVEAAGKVIAISGDTIDCPGLDQLAQAADCLIHCCYLADAELTTPAFVRTATHIIAAAGTVGQIAARNRVKQLVLTHIRPKAPALLQSMLDDVRRSYQGTLHIGSDLMSIDL
ncbi:MAG: MBL fold metallo-hydrolase [Caldilinea sp. CFX5]|nr:MBL fold metallo-hydrolase [Caldilinea sp. CFX5]